MYLITCHYLRSALNAFDKKLCILHSELKCISMVSVLFFILKQYTVCFNRLLLPVHSGSLRRINYLNMYSLAHPLSFESIHFSKGSNFHVLVLSQQLLLCFVVA